jgi:exosortase/archaeosortase family protein
VSIAAQAAGLPPLGASSERTAATQASGGLVALVGVLLVLFVDQGQRAEAWLNAALINATGIAPAEVFGASVVFLRGQAYNGFTVAAGCTATLLLVPFFFLTAGLLGFSRLSPRRCLAALVLVTVLVNAANQGRMLLIAWQMRTLGGERGYEVSHVFLGTVVSTLGVLLAIVVFVGVLVGWSPRRKRPEAGAA